MSTKREQYDGLRKDAARVRANAQYMREIGDLALVTGLSMQIGNRTVRESLVRDIGNILIEWGNEADTKADQIEARMEAMFA